MVRSATSRVSNHETTAETRPSFETALCTIRDGLAAARPARVPRLLRMRAYKYSPSDNDADDVRRRAVFLLDLGPCGGAVFRRQQPAFLSQNHPAIAPPVRQHALVVHQVIALFGGEQARLLLIKRIQKDMDGVG